MPVEVYTAGVQGTSNPNLLTAKAVVNALQELSIQSDRGSYKILNCGKIIVPHLKATLRTVCINMDHFMPYNRDFSELTKHIPVLLLFSHLTSVSLRFGHTFPGLCFGDADLFKMAKAWPFIQYLKLSFRPHMCVTPPSLVSLGPLTSMCLSLTHFSILAMWGPPTLEALRIEGPPSSRLLTLNLGRIYVDGSNKRMITPERILVAICDAFPNIDWTNIHLDVAYYST
ncbi:hypothetical protein C8Q78DRAFT_1084033 [Trametes maxima]|nr:hypothetical protein C8Q78DRAFT_1084033 [Trametes maxima]